MNESAHPTDETLSQYKSGQLDEQATQSLEHHLQTCEECRNRIPAQTSVTKSRAYSRSATGSYIPGTVSIPPELEAMRQYDNIRELGQGGMGVVYLARNTLMGRDEVLKIVNRTMLSRAGGTERFLREIRAATTLSEPKAHLNIVKAYNAQQIGELIVFSMEHVVGDDLSKVLKSSGVFPVHKACGYAYHVALGLGHAHQKGMVHRDIKPSNLMLTRQEGKIVVKILDFGLAKTTQEMDGGDLTGTGRMLGTPPYMAPEQFADATRADIRADIYSLGCTLYQFLAGTPPFLESNIYALMLSHKDKTPTSLHELRPDVPIELAAIVAKMLAKDPADRFQTPKEVAQALKPFLKAVPVKPSGETQQPLVTIAPKPSEPLSVWGTINEAEIEPTISPTRWPRRKFWSMAFFGAVLAGVMITVASSLWRHETPGSSTDNSTAVKTSRSLPVEVAANEAKVEAPPASQTTEWAGMGSYITNDSSGKSGVSFTLTETPDGKFRGVWRNAGGYVTILEGIVEADQSLTFQSFERVKPTVISKEKMTGTGKRQGSRMTVDTVRGNNARTSTNLKLLPNGGSDFRFQGRWRVEHQPNNWRGAGTVVGNRYIRDNPRSEEPWERDGGLIFVHFPRGGLEWLVIDPDEPNKLCGSNGSQVVTWTRP